MRRILLLLLPLMLALGGCYDRHSMPDATEVNMQVDCTFAELRQLCNNECCTITRKATCVGRITSSDSKGNFYRSIIVEDATGGVEVRLGIYNVAVQYPVGLMIAIDLQNTAVAIKNGVVQIGLPPLPHDSAPREFASQGVIDSHIQRSQSIEEIAPYPCRISTIDTSLCGRFVHLSSLHFTPIEENEKPLSDGYFRFTDEEGCPIFVYVSPYAEFADPDIPTSAVAIRGILYHETVGGEFGNQFVIKPRFSDDITAIDSDI